MPRSDECAHLRARVDQLTEALRPFVWSLDSPTTERLEGRVAPYVTEREALYARAVLNWKPPK